MQDSKNGSLKIIGDRFRSSPDRSMIPVNKFPKDLSDLVKQKGVFFMVMRFSFLHKRNIFHLKSYLFVIYRERHRLNLSFNKVTKNLENAA